MKTTIDKGKLQIDIQELVENMTDSEREMFAKYAVFSSTLFSGVINTLVTGEAWDDGWWITGLDQQLRIKLIPLMPKIVSELVKGLLTQHARYAAAVKMHENMLLKLMQSWPRDSECPCEHSCMLPTDRHVFTSDEADAYIAEKLGDEWQAIKAAAQEAGEAVST